MAESLCSPPIAGRSLRSKLEQQPDITNRSGAGKKGDTLVGLQKAVLTSMVFAGTRNYFSSFIATPRSEECMVF